MLGVSAASRELTAVQVEARQLEGYSVHVRFEDGTALYAHARRRAAPTA